MKFIKQSKTIKIINLDKKINENSLGKTKKMRHSSLLPNHLRCIIVGPSNCGKTNTLFSLLLSPHGLRFDNLYVYSKSLHQPKYEYLESIMSNLENIGYHTFSNNTDILSPHEALPNSIFIFDDVACDRQDIIKEYFSMGRHSDVDCFYLCQSYARIPKHLIRDNANFIILFKQDLANLRHVYNNHVNTDMTFDKFCKICNICWENDYGFLIVDKDRAVQEGRYKRGFDEHIIV